MAVSFILSVVKIVAWVERSETREAECRPLGRSRISLRSIRATRLMRGWEADERPEPRSLGLLPSGPDPVGEWLVHRQPPGCYIGRQGPESKRVAFAVVSQFEIPLRARLVWREFSNGV